MTYKAPRFCTSMSPYKVVSQRINVEKHQQFGEFDTITTILQNEEDVICITTWKREDYPKDIDMWQTDICYQDLKSWLEYEDFKYVDMSAEFHGTCERYEAHKQMVECWKGNGISPRGGERYDI